jgi:hypothetical protein
MSEASVIWAQRSLSEKNTIGQSGDIRFYQMCNEVLTYYTQKLNKIESKIKIVSGIGMYTVPEMPKGWGKICGNLKSHSLPPPPPPRLTKRKLGIC